jgi:hypothetical protein
MENYKKIMAILLGTAILICFSLDVFLNYHYAYTRPVKPQPEIGRIYPLNVHNTIVYLTRDEDLQIKLLVRIMIGFIGIASLFTFFYYSFKHNNRSP